MTHIATKISRQFPSYLGQSLSKRYAQVQTRMLEDEKRLLAIELQSCLKAARSRKRLRRVHNLTLLRHRLHYLARSLGETVGDEVFALIEREQYFRKARFALRVLRKHVKDGDPSDYMLDDLRLAMRRGGLTNRAIRTTASEIKSFKKRIEERWEKYRQQREAARLRRMAARSGQPAL